MPARRDELKPATLRRRLLDWFATARRDLPWRRTRDPYRIWLSEIMLQQTRVAAAIPYYERFLERFPTVEALAAAGEQDVLAAWAGLGYYSRARNLRKAARDLAAQGEFPRSYDAIRALPGIGDYTAAAVSSIAFGLPHAALDGNVMRVLARLTADPGDITAPATRRRLQALAQRLLDPRRPGDHNQAVMELGATVCLPRDPQCLLCPWSAHCEARRAGRQQELPVKRRDTRIVAAEHTLLWIERNGSILLWQRPAADSRMAGFWELPEAAQLPQARIGEELGSFRHSITIHRFRFRLVRARIRTLPEGFHWIPRGRLDALPASTILRKAMALDA